MRISSRIACLQPSPTLAVDEAARRLRGAGRRILGLGAGQPDFETPEPIRRAAIDAIGRGVGHYTPVAGTPELRTVIADKLARDNALDYGPDEIVVSCGAKHSIYNVLLTTLEAGDGVIVPAPYWVSYPEMVKLAGGRPIVVEAPAASGFKLGAADLEQAVARAPHARMLMLNSPCNPTGAVYSRAELEAIAEVVRRYDLTVVTDEIYEKIVFDGNEHLCFAAVAPDRRASTIVVNGVSKAFAMPGWRIGYAAAPPEVAAALAKFQGQSTGNAAAVSQAAARAALTMSDEVVAPMVEAYAERRDAVVAGLARVAGVEVRPPEGTFYCFPTIGGLLAATGCANSGELATRLLEAVGIALVPGSAFGVDGCVRISFAAELAIIEEALERLAVFAREPDTVIH